MRLLSGPPCDPGADAFLFGSRARGDYRPDSDWDIQIPVDSQKDTNEIEDKFRDGLYDLELEVGQIISAFIYSKASWKSHLKFSPIYNDIEKEGIPL
jgi:predicted nucleotidyltransferase